jgi:deoxyribonuclease IV
MKPKNTLLLGAHMSIAGGAEEALYRAASINCTAMQIFTHSNRQWQMKELNEATKIAWSEAQKKTGIEHVMVHASYLINMGSSTSETVKQSRSMLKKELKNCHLLSIPLLVLHPGGGQEPSICIDQIAQGINEAFDEDPGSTLILLETMAGQGTQVGYRFEQLAELASKIKNKKRIGFCIDTCHIWAAGYDISTEKTSQKVWEEWDDIIGLSHIKAFHVNDSKQKRGSRVDRHAEIGEGTLGLEAFRLLMNDNRFQSIPKVLETPLSELSDYARNMKKLTDLIEK